MTKAFAKKLFAFPDYYPAILMLYYDNNKLYVFTWSKDIAKGLVDVFIYSQEGKFIEAKTIHSQLIPGEIQGYPSVIKDGYYYQLIENDDEEWELFREKI